jgi:two-component system LytT family sensor kinase
MDILLQLRNVERWLHAVMLVLLYAFLWLTYPGTLPEDNKTIFYWTVTFDFIVFVGCAYVASYALLPRYFIKGKYALFFTLYLALLLTGATLILLNDMVIDAVFPDPEEEEPLDWALFYASTMGMIFLISSVGIGIRALTYWIRSVQQLNAARKEKLQTELAFLRSQMNPHFLFNTLNLIFGNIDKTNKTARDIVVQFSDLLRYQLYECDVDLIAIEKEVTYLRTYIGLQRLRKNSNLDCKVIMSGYLGGFSIAPLLMIPLVENAFKHVSYHDTRENYVTVELSRAGPEFHFKCVNTKAPVPTEDVIETGGLGLRNVRRRLQLLYPEKHRLAINDREETFEVQLSLTL